MKKILSLFLVLGLCFGLTGCGGNDNSKKETPKKEEKVEKPLDLTGTWASNEEGTYQVTVITVIFKSAGLVKMILNHYIGRVYTQLHQQKRSQMNILGPQKTILRKLAVLC